MATYLENLISRRNAVAARLAAFIEGGVGDKANATGGTGSSVDHVGYRESLENSLLRFNKLIADAGEQAQIEDVLTNGPWEIRS